MEGTYPIMLDGALWGKLTVSGKGSMTVFEADCPMREGIIRLSVYGQGKEGRLGVLMPREGRLVLRRALSRAAMRDFPGEIEHVGPSGELPPETPPAPAEVTETAVPVGAAPGEEAEEEAAPETVQDSMPGDDLSDLYWYSSPDGALVCFDGEHSLIALPLGDGRIPEQFPGMRKSIEGREYMVYITKNGRIAAEG